MYNKKIFKRCFDYKGAQWFKNIKYIPLYFKLMHFLIKNGYDEYANWETPSWFIDTMSEILKHHLEKGMTVGIVLDNYQPLGLDDSPEAEQLREENKRLWRSELQRMIDLLDKMREFSADVDDEEREAAKDEFFRLFSRYFYQLWE